MRIAEGGSCNLSSVTMSLHTGTHLDAPCHFVDEGKDITGVPLASYVGPARVVSIKVAECISSADLAALCWDGVERVLFRTLPSDAGDSRFDRNFVYLSEDAAEFLGRHNIILVGTDSPSVDAFRSKTMQSHKALLGHGVAILEGLRLAHVQDGDYELICLPLKLAGGDGSPVRAVLCR